MQDVTNEAAGGWSLSLMSARAKLHHKDLIDGAKNGSVPWWKVHRFEMQRKGAWVEDLVLDDPRIKALGVTGKSTGVDISHKGLRYDIMSGTDSDFVTHATRQGMSDMVFRMIYFGSKRP
ncbi:hypothetical protein [Lysobacter capsici]|uniref:hypothetical protein n=1 Tax=Lysobacter capsici TaxID=435897 RepID=UPI0012907806|nr:hypothetical protein [Lysobacter capsici]